MKRILFAVMVVLLAGCQNDSRYEHLDLAPQYGSTAEVRDALERSGLGCQGFQSVGQDRRDIGEKDALDVATCRVENRDVAIMIWLRLGEAQDWARSRRAMGCQFAQSLNTSPPVYVDGGRWTISLNSRSVAEKIAEAIGGQARFADCSVVD